MKITPDLLASLTGGSVEGDGNVEITGFAKIEEARHGDVTFIANPKYAPLFEATKASAVLVREDFDRWRSDVTLIKVKDPYFALAELLKTFAPKSEAPCGIEQPAHVGDGTMVPENAYVGSFAYIGKNVKIGSGVRIYPQVYIGDGCVIGDDTVIRAGVRIYEGCVIGKRCIIHSGAVIGADGFGFAPVGDSYDKIPQIGNVVLEDDIEIGANTTVDRATFGSTVIRKGTKLDNLIQVAHNVEIGENNVFAAQTGIAGSTKIGNCNRVGGQVGFAGHIKVGDHNEIGAQSGIPNNVGNGRRLIGYPAVDQLLFAKTQVYLKRLSELFNKK